MVSEARVQSDLRTEAPRHGWGLLRNNSGACVDETGRMVRYGLGNDSAALNTLFKSSDLIGIRPVMITQDMVGQTIGQFAAIEVKREGWRFNPNNDREMAQQRFGDWVLRHGGWFQFATSTEDIKWSG